MRKHIYGVYGIEIGNFSFSDEDRTKYKPEILYTNSGTAYYQIGVTFLQFIHLKWQFLWLRVRHGYKVRIRKIEN